MAHLDELKEVLTETLERRGVLNSMRGRIRGELFSALNDPSSVRPKPSNETILINELIREYLEFNQYNYTAMTFKTETGQVEAALSRDFLETELKVQTIQKNRKIPLLYHLVHTHKIQREEEASDYNHQDDKEVDEDTD